MKYNVLLCQNKRACKGVISDGIFLEKKFKTLFTEISGKNYSDSAKPGKHNIFTVSISLCPNGCSRPQIADIGIIAALAPQVVDGQCNSCGNCLEACIEDAIHVEDKKVYVDDSKCLYCGDCINCCLTGAIVENRIAFRILLGGKLGRHPQLGIQLDQLFNAERVVEVVGKSIDFYLKNRKAEERFGPLINRLGLKWIDSSFSS